MANPIFTGSGVAIVTPFHENGVDFERLTELLEFHVANALLMLSMIQF